jgi:flagellum-specific ATP synthase
MSAPHALARLAEAITLAADTEPLVRISGTVTEVSPVHWRVSGLSRFVAIGENIGIGEASIPGEVVRIDEGSTIVKPFGTGGAVVVGDSAHKIGALRLAPHGTWKGRIIDAFGRPIDGGAPLAAGSRDMPLDASPPPALTRGRVKTPLRTGVRVVDLFTPICAGQRIGIFAGSGVGKSTLLGMMAGAKGFDAVVIALVGERGREVREFIEDSLGANRAKAVTIVATGDESPMMRRLAPKTAMAIAEYFRDEGQSVLLIVDSVTRFAHAARDVALAAGEPAVARGYAPSVFSDLPKLLERAGPGAEGTGGTITGIFSVLVDGDNHNDPVADSIRGTLDGHIVLDRAIADGGRFPAVNVLGSISRLAQHVWTKEQATLVSKLKGLIARFEDTSDLRLMGGYQQGADADLDQAITLVPKIYEAMRQSPGGNSADAFRELAEVLQKG